MFQTPPRHGSSQGSSCLISALPNDGTLREACLEDDRLNLAEQGASPPAVSTPPSSSKSAGSPGQDFYQLSSQSWQYAVGSVCKLKDYADQHLRPEQHKQKLQNEAASDQEGLIKSLWVS